MKPVDQENPFAKQWTLAEKGQGYIAYVEGASAVFDLIGDTASYVVKRIDPVSGGLTVDPQKIRGGKRMVLENRRDGPVVIWLSR